MSGTGNNRFALYVIMLIAAIIAALIVEYLILGLGGETGLGYVLIMGVATGLAADIAHYIATMGSSSADTSRSTS